MKKSERKNRYCSVIFTLITLVSVVSVILFVRGIRRSSVIVEARTCCNRICSVVVTHLESSSPDDVGDMERNVQHFKRYVFGICDLMEESHRDFMSISVLTLIFYGLIMTCRIKHRLIGNRKTISLVSEFLGWHFPGKTQSLFLYSFLTSILTLIGLLLMSWACFEKYYVHGIIQKKETEALSFFSSVIEKLEINGKAIVADSIKNIDAGIRTVYQVIKDTYSDTFALVVITGGMMVTIGIVLFLTRKGFVSNCNSCENNHV